MKKPLFRCFFAPFLTTWVACGNRLDDYAGQGQIQEDLHRLYKAKESGDEGTIMKESERLLASKQTVGAIRITPPIYRAEVFARRGNIQEVNALFDRQFPFVAKRTGGCGQAVWTSIKGEVWQATGGMELAVAD